MDDWSQLHGIQLLYTPIYHPKSNGSVERVHLELNKLIPKAMEVLNLKTGQWSQALVYVANILNSTPHTITGFAPEILQKGYLTDQLYLYTSNGRQNMAEMWNIARERLIKASISREHLPKNAGVAKLEKGTPVKIIIPGRPAVKAKVLIDYGLTAFIEKTDAPEGRFKRLVVAKSHLYLDFLENKESPTDDRYEPHIF